LVYLKPVSFGALLSLGHAPLNLWFLSFAAIFLSILGIAKQRDRYKIALFTFFLGMGYFILTLNWIVEPFLIDFYFSRLDSSVCDFFYFHSNVIILVYF
jgi:apolipoprotein N-acyltransferase